MSTTKIRFGIVGAGGIATKFKRDMEYVKNAEITAVSARTKETAERYQTMYQVEYAFSSYEALAQSNVVDAVYIATPHNFHKDQAIMFMKHGKHVLVEKPIAVNKKELLEMIAVANEYNVLLMEAMWTRFLPSTNQVKDLIDGQTLGELITGTIHFGYELITNYPLTGRLLDPNLAGGSLLDLGIYNVSFMHYLFGNKITHIEATMKETVTKVDEEMLATIHYEEGALITIQTSISRNLDNHAELVFENGTILMEDFSRCTDYQRNEESIHIGYRGEGFVDQIEAFSTTILAQKKENEIVSYKAMVEVMGILDAIRHTVGLTYPFE